MLRVGLTGGLGSGKSTAARLFAARGAHVLAADEIGREMMRPGEAVYKAIVEHFGKSVVAESGELDRKALARISFEEGRVEELNAIVHPAVIARQAKMAREIGAKEPAAVVIVESALVFETKHGDAEGETGEPWRSRFDCIILVTASEAVKVGRYVQRVGGDALSPERRAEFEAEARQRLARQIPDEEKIPLSDFVLENDGPAEDLELQIEQLWPVLRFAAEAGHLREAGFGPVSN
ncbi:dephospho-CoA kinase [Edaphobacter bradus]|uniref:dephospho-CoA kinase n=1 Tax=Edaphobacter bradus TaxID=2259016 RepID=UPI0021E035E4|nr:dephospho-CoA kinase [Edaphobacter bradus]